MFEKYLTPDYWLEIFHDAISWIITMAPTLVLLVMVYFLIGYLLNKATVKFLEGVSKKYDDSNDIEGKKRVVTLTRLTKAVLAIGAKTVIIFIILSELGIDVAPLIAGAGILGLAVGFGAQELVRDIISGFFIIVEDQIRVGDVVNINGFGGVVEKIHIRTIILRDYSGVVHVIQNGKINSLSNMTKQWSAMVFDIGVAYKEDTDQVIEVIKNVGTDLQNDEVFGVDVLEPLEIAGLDKFGESEIVIKARLKTTPGMQWPLGREFRKRLKKAFDENGIDIPFPHRTIFWGEGQTSEK